VVRLAQLYLQRRNEGQAALATPGNEWKTQAVDHSNDRSDLDLKVKISSILTPDQVAILQSGNQMKRCRCLPPFRLRSGSILSGLCGHNSVNVFLLWLRSNSCFRLFRGMWLLLTYWKQNSSVPCIALINYRSCWSISGITTSTFSSTRARTVI
jgi:hypothetical protein